MKIIRRKLIRAVLLTLMFFLIVLLSSFFLYFNNLNRVDSLAVSYYESLKKSLESKGYSSKLLVISTKRNKYHNQLLTYFGAAKKSQHLHGKAIDFIVFDVNNDGESNETDVDIVFKLLDEEIIKDKGGIGTYKGESSFINRQMIHIDSRGHKARWHR